MRLNRASIRITRLLTENPSPICQPDIATIRRTLAALAILLIVSGAVTAQEIEYVQGPENIIHISQPTVIFRFRATKMPGLPDLVMYLNDQQVDARYDPERSELRYTPPEPLPRGLYTVKCGVKYQNYQPREYLWSFVVKDGVLPTPPPPDEEARFIAEQVNAYRRKAGLPDVRYSNALGAAAASHARYLHINNESSHEEYHDHKLFIAGKPQERAMAFGYVDECNEDLQCGCATPEAAVSELFNAPYHRALFLRTGDVDFGGGRMGNRTVLVFGGVKSPGVVIYPADGQRDVPLSWVGPEIPDPRRIHGVGDKVGYIVTFMYSAPTRVFIDVKESTLKTASGRDVPVFINDSTNDDLLPNGVFLIPKEPLEPDTTYVASISATTRDGQDISRTWRFTTVGTDEFPPPPPPPMTAPVAPPQIQIPQDWKGTIDERRENLPDGTRKRTFRIANTSDAVTVRLLVEVFDQEGEEVLLKEFSLESDRTMEVVIPTEYPFPHIKIWMVLGGNHPNALLFDKEYRPLGSP